MGHNNIWLIKFQKLIPICVAILIAVIGVFIYHNFRHSNDDSSEVSFKPMVKVNDVIYYWSGDVDIIDTEKYEFIEEVKFSNGLLSTGLTQDDENISSNVYPIGTKIYRYDANSVLVALGNGFSILTCIQ